MGSSKTLTFLENNYLKALVKLSKYHEYNFRVYFRRCGWYYLSRGGATVQALIYQLGASLGASHSVLKYFRLKNSWKEH